DKHPMWQLLRIQGPRILAFSCITIIILAFFQLPYPDTPHLSRKVCYILLLLSFSWYFLIYQFCNRVLSKSKLSQGAQLRYWHRARFINYSILTVFTTLVIL